MSLRRVVLIQLPIPPLGPGPIRGNVPLAGAYLKLFAESQGLARQFRIDLFPPDLANALSESALAEEILARAPSLVGFTCYVWNIERTLWICSRLKQRDPSICIVLGGPEITADNAWVLNTPDYDYAVIGEGEQTFAALLSRLAERSGRMPLPMAGEGPGGIPGLYVPAHQGPRYDPARRPTPRTPIEDINILGSPYLAGILDAADERMMLLETTRGCVFNCKFCYYPKSYDKQYFLSRDLVRDSLRHAADRQVDELFLLDPTLNQRKDFADLLQLIADENRGRRFRCFGELRAEGINERTARLLREANFTEVEVGLQSIEPDAMNLMDRNNNLRAFERGVRAMMAEGIAVKVDLIVGLPGDTVESIRRGMHYLRDSGLYSDVQVFNLAVLPGTAFRQEADSLGLRFQPRPPYYVTRTPALGVAEIFQLMREAQDVFEVDFDQPATPLLGNLHPDGVWSIDGDAPNWHVPSRQGRRQAFTIWATGHDLPGVQGRLVGALAEVLDANPHTTVQFILEPTSRPVDQTAWNGLLSGIAEAGLERATYLDKYYAMQPGSPRGAKRVVLALDSAWRTLLPSTWVQEVAESWAAIVWLGLNSDLELGPNEYAHHATPAHAAAP